MSTAIRMDPTNCTTWQTTPFEKLNLVDFPEYGERISELRAELEDWYDRYVDPRMDGAKNNVTGRGQIGLAGSEDYDKPFADDVEFYHAR